jgi:hypothetical protein
MKVNLKNGAISAPERVFSEANLDLLALLIFLAFAKESAKRGQAKFIILDDVLQSVDASIRVLVADYILREFSDWQMIYTVHDRLWLEQLRELFRLRGISFCEAEIIRWQFDVGPMISGGGRSPEQPLQKALADGDVVSICAQSGLLLEQIANILSYSLPISVTRRKGDKYTLGDLWPGILKALSKTTEKAQAEEVNRWLHLRNLIGAHFNEWAHALSQQEAEFFGISVLQLLNAVRCNSCLRWIERKEAVDGQRSLWSCRCGKTRILPL